MYDKFFRAGMVTPLSLDAARRTLAARRTFVSLKWVVNSPNRTPPSSGAFATWQGDVARRANAVVGIEKTVMRIKLEIRRCTAIMLERH